MTLFDFAMLIKTTRELQELSRKAPQSQERRVNAARYELRLDQLTRMLLADDKSTVIQLPIN